jgi:hypothetical protein
MAKSLSELRKARGNFEDLTKEIEKQASKGGQKEDDRFWQCAVDKAGNGSAIIRFLTAPQGEDFPYVRMWTHGFQGPTGKWYIENSRTTLGRDEKDPVTELNNELWASKVKENEDIARKQKRKLNYYSNVLIISDPANPENEGKVKLFRYGAKIFEKLQAAMKPEFDDDPSFNPFDFWEGANFRLKITRVDKYANFDKSALAAQTVLNEDDEALQKIWDQCHSLKAIVAPDQFKSYDELTKRLNFVLATGAPGKNAEQSEIDPDDEAFIRQQSKNAEKRAAAKSEPKKEEFDDVPPFDVDPAPAAKSKPTAAKKPAAETVAEDQDDDLEYFRKLAEG